MTPGSSHAARARRLERIVARLLPALGPAIRWLHKPSSRWVRIPAGVLFCLGGVFAILPFLGLWMLPVGLVLLSYELPIFGRLTDRCLEWIEVRRPHWMADDTDFNDIR